MGEPLTIIRNGTVVTQHAVKQADIWIQQGKIVRTHPDTLLKKWSGGQALLEIDASNFYILPGFLQVLKANSLCYRPTQSYVQQIRLLIEQGITTFIDTIQIGNWMDESQCMYQLSPHYNSPIDYAVRIEITAGECHQDRLRQLIKQGFRLIQIMVYTPEEVHRINWNRLYPLLLQERVSLHLHILGETISREDRQNIIEAWLQYCHYGKIRTCVNENQTKEVIKEAISFYHLQPVGKLEEKQKEQGWLVSQLKNWYLHHSLFASIQELTIPSQLWVRGEAERILSLMVRLASTNVAKLAGCYPVKGSLLPGADADLLFLKKDKWLTNHPISTMLILSEICNPVSVMSKGTFIYQNGTHHSTIGAGKHLRSLRPYNYAM
ncbi:hypothetical protein EEL32_05290 [Brevibacillus laterosporus]|uniref:Uncharacterized protein n=1 Tax=Brevibacillus laterosporus TaxID=1465 RepID=A0A502IUY5_BRELA|nr:hypothetical protein [Brevibacillus laterosporus]QDX93831.1 hypothetical protein EEL30_16950 [Brevibacillus laterosporus]RAP27670.1 hypothetical protein C2W64_00819 [Brevibacillus laterosporus]TPG67781.1 hypothetical protein EEL31_03835 [Brevibacillus laterosporus]TPG89528.1 hypothetical protein EEL32_05290 [Brevibacillus laterosporus]